MGISDARRSQSLRPTRTGCFREVGLLPLDAVVEGCSKENGERVGVASLRSCGAMCCSMSSKSSRLLAASPPLSGCTDDAMAAPVRREEWREADGESEVGVSLDVDARLSWLSLLLPADGPAWMDAIPAASGFRRSFPSTRAGRMQGQQRSPCYLTECMSLCKSLAAAPPFSPPSKSAGTEARERSANARVEAAERVVTQRRRRQRTEAPESSAARHAAARAVNAPSKMAVAVHSIRRPGSGTDLQHGYQL